MLSFLTSRSKAGDPSCSHTVVEAKTLATSSNERNHGVSRVEMHLLTADQIAAMLTMLIESMLNESRRLLEKFRESSCTWKSTVLSSCRTASAASFTLLACPASSSLENCTYLGDSNHICSLAVTCFLQVVRLDSEAYFVASLLKGGSPLVVEAWYRSLLRIRLSSSWPLDLAILASADFAKRPGR